MLTVTIIGIGRMGRALARSLMLAGHRIDALVVSSHAAVQEGIEGLGLELFVPLNALDVIGSDVVFICTQDNEISAAADAMSRKIVPGTTVFHTSGALSSEILGPLAGAGAKVGSMHPLVSISERSVPEPFHGAYFCVEGQPDAIPVANEIVADLGGIPFSIDTSKKALYHASAVMACGHLVALADAAFSMMENCGPNADLSRRLLMPLISSTIANISAESTAAALTGPFARTDVSTIERHLEALGRCNDRELLQIYTALGRRSLDLALRVNADEGRVDAIRDRLSIAERDAK